MQGRVYLGPVGKAYELLEDTPIAEHIIGNVLEAAKSVVGPWPNRQNKASITSRCREVAAFARKCRTYRHDGHGLV